MAQDLTQNLPWIGSSECENQHCIQTSTRIFGYSEDSVELAVTAEIHSRHSGVGFDAVCAPISRTRKVESSVIIGPKGGGLRP
jgi:hypothetical protein